MWSIKFRPVSGLQGQGGKKVNIKNNKMDVGAWWLFISVYYVSLTVLLTEDPCTEALCSLAGKGRCRGRGTRWVCVWCPHTEDKTWTWSRTHLHFEACFIASLPPHVPFGWRRTWPSRGCPAPPRAPWPPRLLAPSPSEGRWRAVRISVRAEELPHWFLETAPGSPPVAAGRKSFLFSVTGTWTENCPDPNRETTSKTSAKDKSLDVGGGGGGFYGNFNSNGSLWRCFLHLNQIIYPLFYI